MATTTLVNRLIGGYRWHPNDVIIHRPSKWGNPYTHLPPGRTKYKLAHVVSRKAAIECYRDYILEKPDLLRDLHELVGHRLVCYCKPLPCHGDVLLDLIRQGYAK